LRARWLAAGALSFALGLAGCSAPPPAQRDVVIFLIDTLRADHTGPYGRWPSPTPFLDQLARESVVFEQAYAPAPWTLPSTVSLLTSQPLCQHRVAVDGDVISAQTVPLAERMAASGRRTASFFANPYAGALSGLDRGFDESRLVQAVDGDLVRRWLDSIGDRPFFLYAHNVEPHDPYRGGVRGISAGQAAQINRLLNRYRELTRVDWLAGRPLGTTRNEGTQDALRRKLATLHGPIEKLYDGDVGQADGRLAGVVAELRRRGRLANTVLVVIADHGEALGEHDGWQHDHALYDELVRVPLLIRLPGGAQGGRRIAEPVSLLDVAPTVAELLGEPGLAEGDAGRSLVPWIEGREPGDDGPQVVSTRWNRKKYYAPLEATRGNLNVAVREGSWKAIWNAASDTLELYDLARDPRERNDRSRDEPARAARLAARARAAAAPCQAAQPGPARPPELDPAEQRRLRELGYLDE